MIKIIKDSSLNDLLIYVSGKYIGYYNQKTKHIIILYPLKLKHMKKILKKLKEYV